MKTEHVKFRQSHDFANNENFRLEGKSKLTILSQADRPKNPFDASHHFAADFNRASDEEKDQICHIMYGILQKDHQHYKMLKQAGHVNGDTAKKIAFDIASTIQFLEQHCKNRISDPNFQKTIDAAKETIAPNLIVLSRQILNKLSKQLNRNSQFSATIAWATKQLEQAKKLLDKAGRFIKPAVDFAVYGIVVPVLDILVKAAGGIGSLLQRRLI